MALTLTTSNLYLEAVKCFHAAGEKGHKEASANLKDILEAIEEAGGESIPGLSAAVEGKAEKPLRYPIGCILRVVGQHAETGEYAERAARVRNYDAMSQCFLMEIDSDMKESCQVREENLRPLEKGTLIEIVGLKSRADLNGKGASLHTDL